MVASPCLAPNRTATKEGGGRFRRWSNVAVNAVRIPVTLGYVAVLLILGMVLSGQSGATQAAILLHSSTNLHNLTRGHIGTLLSSAFVTGDGAAWMTVPLLGCLLALAELRFGSRRMVRTFLAGHIGATLIVAAGLLVAVSADWISSSVSKAQDVGVSYGAMAVIGALMAALPRPAWISWALAWTVAAVVGVWHGQTFTNVGHLIALVIGLAIAFWKARTLALTARQFTRVEAAMLAVGSALGCCFLLA